MKLLFFEPFFGGSHQDFAMGFKTHSCHEVTLVTLPDRFWKWRMRGAALYLIHHIKDFSVFDAIIVTDMMDLTDFLSLAGDTLPPVVMYFHENQLSYPLTSHQKQDVYLGFTNIISAMAADKILFNSEFHLKAFIDAAGRLIKQMPDKKPEWMTDWISNKSQVLYPGCRFEKGRIDLQERDMKKPLIIWNHRWEPDKNPEFFFDVLTVIQKKNIPFSLALLGENPDVIPDVFMRAKDQFKDQLVTCGYAESRDAYLSWLKKGAIVFSCAVQENFGISVVEAVRYGCVPLLPNRLSYPEIIPEDCHSEVLYRTERDLIEKLENMLVNYQDYLLLQQKLSDHMEQFSWETRITVYDTGLKNLVRRIG